MNTEPSLLEQFLPAFFWLIVILITANFIRSNHRDKPEYRYYLLNVYFKLFFALAFASYYYFGIKGDTVAYFDSAVSLNNLFIKSPSLYFQELWNTPDYQTYWQIYDAQTGYPPGWIYREPEAFFVSKFISLFSFLAMKSFFAMTFMLAFLAASASWKLFTLINGMNLMKEKYLAIAFLFIPSVNFWCTGISKDAMTYIFVCYVLYYGFRLLNEKINFKLVAYLLFSIFIIYHVREVILYVLTIPFILSIFTRYFKKKGYKPVSIGFMRTFVLLTGFTLFSLNFSSKSEDELLASNAFLQEAATTQGDFESNVTYEGSRYSLGTIEFTLVGLIQIAPAAAIAGLFRPLIWEALEPTLLLNGLESLIFLYGLLRFFGNRPLSKFRYIKNNEFLLFSLIFVLLYAFITGLTSGLFGVLVRLRAPLLPFLMLLLFVDFSSVLKRKKQEADTEFS